MQLHKTAGLTSVVGLLLFHAQPCFGADIDFGGLGASTHIYASDVVVAEQGVWSSPFAGGFVFTSNDSAGLRAALHNGHEVVGFVNWNPGGTISMKLESDGDFTVQSFDLLKNAPWATGQNSYILRGYGDVEGTVEVFTEQFVDISPTGSPVTCYLSAENAQRAIKLLVWSGPGNWSPDGPGMIDRVVTGSGGPVVIPPESALKLAGRGMHFFLASDDLFYAQGLKTVNSEYSWHSPFGSSAPVEYTLTISEFPNDAAGMQAVIYLAPDGSGIVDSRPDYRQPVCLRVAITADGTGKATARVAYKDHEVDTDGAPGHEYDVPDDGTGQGGTIASLNNAPMKGTWTLRMESNTSVTLVAPDMQTAQGSLLQATADKFANPLSVWFAARPGNASNYGKHCVIQGIQISGVDTPLSEDFSTSPLSPALQPSAKIPEGIVLVSRPAHWVQWTAPAIGFSLHKGQELGAWAPADDLPAPFALPGLNIRQVLFMPEVMPSRMFFRLLKP